MSVNLGPQFQTLYRGMTVTPDQVNVSSMGTHWTPDRQVAEDFATFDAEGNAGPGTVVTASVHKRHVTDWRTSPDAFDPSRHREREVPLRQGAVLHIQNVERLDDDGATPATIPTGRFRTGRA